jgi:hypothetical protein
VVGTTVVTLAEIEHDSRPLWSLPIRIWGNPDSNLKPHNSNPYNVNGAICTTMTNLFNDGQRLWKQYQQQLLPLQLKSQLKKILTEQRLQFQNLAESVWWCSGESPGQYIRGLFVLAIIGVEAYHVKVTTFETIRLATKWWNSTCEWPTVSNDLGVLLSMASIFTTVRELTTDMPLEVPMLAASELIPHDSNDDMAKKLSIFQCTMRSHCKMVVPYRGGQRTTWNRS